MIPENAVPPSPKRGQGGFLRGLVTAAMLLAVPAVALCGFWETTVAQVLWSEGSPRSDGLAARILGRAPEIKPAHARVRAADGESAAIQEDVGMLLDDWEFTSVSPKK